MLNVFTSARVPACLAPSAVAVAATSLALTACGDSDDKKTTSTGKQERRPLSMPQREVLGTISELQTSTRARDAQRICGQLFTRQFAASIARRSPGKSCEKAVAKNLFTKTERLAVSNDIPVKGRTATATVMEPDGAASRLELVMVGDAWRIAGIRPVQPGR